jgi:hypothetical protein
MRLCEGETHTHTHTHTHRMCRSIFEDGRGRGGEGEV